MKIRIVDKFIVKKVISAYFFVVAILLSVIGVIQITEKNEKIIKHNLSFLDMAEYMLDFFLKYHKSIWKNHNPNKV